MDYDDVKKFQDDVRSRDGIARFDLQMIEEGFLNLSMIEVYPLAWREGIGSQAMRDLVDFADGHDATITLTPESYNRYGNRNKRGDARLYRWYAGFGFKKNTGRNADYTLCDAMYRRPIG